MQLYQKLYPHVSSVVSQLLYLFIVFIVLVWSDFCSSAIYFTWTEITSNSIKCEHGMIRISLHLIGWIVNRKPEVKALYFLYFFDLSNDFHINISCSAIILTLGFRSILKQLLIKVLYSFLLFFKYFLIISKRYFLFNEFC